MNFNHIHSLIGEQVARQIILADAIELEKSASVRSLLESDMKQSKEAVKNLHEGIQLISNALNKIQNERTISEF